MATYEPDARTGTAGNDPGRETLAPADVARIMLRPIASSLPLGFFAFSVGSILLTALELHWVPLAQTRPLLVIVLAFVVPLETLAGVFAFLARDSGAATALIVLGTAWAATATTMLMGAPGATSPALGIFLLMLSAMMILLSVGALRSKPLFGVLLAIGAARFAFSGAFQVASWTAGGTVSGWIGVPLTMFALYGGLALLLEDGAQQTVLPLGRRGRARTSLEGEMRHQIHLAEREPGVRRQL